MCVYVCRHCIYMYVCMYVCVYMRVRGLVRACMHACITMRKQCPNVRAYTHLNSNSSELPTHSYIPITYKHHHKRPYVHAHIHACIQPDIIRPLLTPTHTLIDTRTHVHDTPADSRPIHTSFINRSPQSPLTHLALQLRPWAQSAWMLVPYCVPP